MLAGILRSEELSIPKHIEDHFHVPVVVGEDVLLNSFSEIRIVLVVLLEEADLHFSNKHRVCGHQGTRSSQIRDGSDLTEV